MNIYLQIEFGTGRAYHYSKTEKEEYELFENKEGKTSYRKYYKKGVYGVLKGVSLRSSDFGDQISVEMIDKDKNTVFLNIPMSTQKGGFSAYAESLIRHLPSLVEGNSYRFYPYAMDKEGSDYKTYGISVKIANVLEETAEEESIPKLSYAYTKDGVKVEGDVPEVVWTEKLGKRIMNTDAKDEYLYNVLISNAKDARKGTTPVSSAPKADSSKPAATAKPATAKATPAKGVQAQPAQVATTDDDDLPF